MQEKGHSGDGVAGCGGWWYRGWAGGQRLCHERACLTRGLDVNLEGHGAPLKDL